MNLYEELQARGLVENTTHDELHDKLNEGGLSFYVGFDPTANSLHVGQLAVFNIMSLLQKHGHRPIGLMGGATGMIGDPGGKNAERNLLTAEQINSNIAGIKGQLSRFLDFNATPAATVVNNADWLGGFSYIEFLRDVGKHFSVNTMITRDSVKSRIGREGAGISYTEFSYMLLQAYDFYELAKAEDVTLQLGGSDQWGNIVSGIDLSRRMGLEKHLFGLCIPLVTKADGNKFGKSEGGTIWLDPEKTSPYAFYQFFLGQADEDVIKFIKLLTQVPLDEIQELITATVEEPHLRKAQKRLAEELTRTTHGQEQLDKVLQASKVLFGGTLEGLDDQDIQSIFAELPSTEKTNAELKTGWLLIDALVETGACASKGQARKLIQQGGANVNNVQQKDIEYSLTAKDLATDRFMVLRAGKKNYRLVEIV